MTDHNETMFTDGKVKIHLRPGNCSSDWLVVEEVYKNNCYGFEPSFVSYDGIVIDVGANIGAFSLLVPSNIKVLAFEPEPHNFALLKSNLDENGRNNVTAFNVAVGKSGETTVADLQGGSYMDAEEGSKVKRVSLNDVDFYKCDFLKMDCEGAEYQIFDDITDGNLRKIKKLAIEFHPFDNGWHEETIRRLEKFFDLKTLDNGIVTGVAK